MNWYWIAIAIALCVIAPPILGVIWYEAPGLRRLVKRIRGGRRE